MDLPYKAEYAKTGRSRCRECKILIDEGHLRLAVMLESRYHDIGVKIAYWYHDVCFFYKLRPKSAAEIDHLESLRIEDQNLIKEKIEGFSAIVPEKNSKGKKRNANADAIRKLALADFKIDCPKQSRVTCRACKQKIMKTEIRITNKDYTTEIGKTRGGEPIYHHLPCFAKVRTDLGYFESAEILPGFKSLKKNDRDEAIKQLPAIYDTDVPVPKKLKIENESDVLSGKETKQLTEQNKLLYKYIDAFKDNDVAKSTLKQILDFNHQSIPSGFNEILEHVADIMTFGAIEPCSNCKKGNFIFKKYEYVCDGTLSDWAKCQATIKEPKRKPCLIPSHLKKAYTFLKNYKYKPRVRIINKVQNIEENKQVVVEREAPPLYNMVFFIVGQPNCGRDVLKDTIYKLGGRVVTSSKNQIITAAISTPEEITKMGKRMKEFELLGLKVVSEDFVNEAVNYVGKIPELLELKTISTWKIDSQTQLPSTSTKPEFLHGQIHNFKCINRDADETEQFFNGKVKHSCMLGLVDVQNNRNDFYKLQLLVGNKSTTLVTAWGRIGTTLGDRVHNFPTVKKGMKAFEDKYKELTGNVFNKPFKKVVGHYVPLELDDEKLNINLSLSSSSSILSTPVQELIRLIFDVNPIKKFMKELNLDIAKMPLGKLNKSQIEKAAEVLLNLKNLIENNETESSKFIDGTNQFYTLIPYSFDFRNPPILDNPEIIQEKFAFADNLMQLEAASSLIKSTLENNSIDEFYSLLNTEINALPRDCEEYVLIEEYVKNTTNSTQDNYKFTIDEIFSVKRQGEEDRYKPFSHSKNRTLLFYRSRVTNFIGFLSQGLRNFFVDKRGISFTDVADLCDATRYYNKGLILLCEVALGNIHEKHCKVAYNWLPTGNSIKLSGLHYPDPAASKFLDGVQIPSGKITSTDKMTNFGYNSYIVFDPAQIKMKYLLQVDFNLKKSNI